jgi:hypothetical protein
LKKRGDIHKWVDKWRVPIGIGTRKNELARIEIRKRAIEGTAGQVRGRR